MRTAIFAALAFALTSCATPAAVTRQGRPLALPLPQAVEQCRAQPELDWCGHARR